MATDRLVVGATNSVTLKGLKNEDDNPPTYPVDATVVLTGLYDANDDLVLGTGNIAMPYIEGIGRSTIYRGAIPHTVPLVVGETYTRRVTATDADGNVRPFNADIVAERG